jgi:AraC-like DNA-binding protein
VAMRRRISKSAIDRYIDDSFRREERLTVGQLAAAFGVDRKTLSRAAREILGEPLAGYLRERKLARARQLLRAGRTNARAAYQSGYATRTGFQRMFRRVEGTTAGDYRDRHRRRSAPRRERRS